MVDNHVRCLGWTVVVRSESSQMSTGLGKSHKGPPLGHHHHQASASPFLWWEPLVDMRLLSTELFLYARYQKTRLPPVYAQVRGLHQSPAHRNLDGREDINKQTISNGFTPMAADKPKSNQPAVPRPSASVLLVSPQNQVLLLQRVKQSSSFASAHVFPGGNVSEFHDGRAPEPDSAQRHVDSEVYRKAAIRETFEESGILLARNAGFGRLIEVPEAEREEGRKLVHSNKVPFEQWLAQKGGRADTGE